MKPPRREGSQPTTPNDCLVPFAQRGPVMVAMLEMGMQAFEKLDFSL